MLYLLCREFYTEIKEKIQKMFSRKKQVDISPVLPEKKSIFLERILFFLSFSVPFLLLLFLRMKCVALQGGEPGTDSFYHAAMALGGKEVYAAEKFPFLAFSLWKETFADKELFYHILLQGLFALQSLFKSDPFPFTMPAMVFAGAGIAGFAVLLKSLKIPGKIIFPSSILFSCGVFAFTYRFLMLRPHVFSIALLLFSCALFSVKNFSWRLAGFFLASFLYAYSYSNPHFLFLIILPYTFFLRKEYDWKKLLLLPLCVFAGLLLAYTFHPQSPNIFAIWKVQSIDALLNPVFYGGKLTPRLTPMEMMPGNFAWFRNALPFYILFYLCIFLFIRIREKTCSPAFTAGEKSIFFLSVFFTAGTLAVLRAIEYALPFTAAAFAILFSRSQKEKIGFFAWKMPSVRVYALLYLLAAVFLFINISLMLKSNFRNTVPRGPAEFLKNNTPENSLVVNLDWGDFPAMFYANRHNHFLWGMDPAFSYAVSPGKARKLENCVINSIKKEDVDKEIRFLTGADYAFVLSRREKFIRYLKDRNWKIVYESEEGCIFSLKKP